MYSSFYLFILKKIPSTYFISFSFQSKFSSNIVFYICFISINKEE